MMTRIDTAVTVIYLVAIVAMGCSAGLFLRRRGAGAARDYFLAGGRVGASESSLLG